MHICAVVVATSSRGGVSSAWRWWCVAAWCARCVYVCIAVYVLRGVVRALYILGLGFWGGGGG